MYKDDGICLEVYKNYNDLIQLFKRKGSSIQKISELNSLLNYFNDDFEKFNNEEQKIIKNVILMASDIIYKVNHPYSEIKENRNNCINIIESLKEKQKRPTK